MLGRNMQHFVMSSFKLINKTGLKKSQEDGIRQLKYCQVPPESQHLSTNKSTQLRRNLQLRLAFRSKFLQVLICNMVSAVYFMCKGLWASGCHVMSCHIILLVLCKQAWMCLSARTPEEINLRSERAWHLHKAVRHDFVFSGFHRSNVPPTD